MTNFDPGQQLEQELSALPALRGTPVSVTHSNGTVTLRGTAPALTARTQAEREARRAPGVHTVVNEIVVVPPASARADDEELRERVTRVLDWNADLAGTTTRVTVREGVVTVSGEVDWEYQKQAALTAVLPLSGLRAVEERITVRQAVAADQVEQKIRQALHRNADLDAERIRVIVQGAKITLRGTVRTWAEAEAAASAAWAAPGVAGVENHLRTDEELASV